MFLSGGTRSLPRTIRWISRRSMREQNGDTMSAPLAAPRSSWSWQSWLHLPPISQAQPMSLERCAQFGRAWAALSPDHEGPLASTPPRPYMR